MHAQPVHKHFVSNFDLTRPGLGQPSQRITLSWRGTEYPIHSIPHRVCTHRAIYRLQCMRAINPSLVNHYDGIQQDGAPPATLHNYSSALRMWARLVGQLTSRTSRYQPLRLKTSWGSNITAPPLLAAAPLPPNRRAHNTLRRAGHRLIN